MKLRHFDVCSGIGGFSLGFRWAALSEPVAFCEIDPYCQKVLAKNFPNIPIFNDVKELVNDRPESTRTIPDHDILTSGYPCQPFSVAGQRRGEEDERNIWRFVFEIVKRKHPTWCVFENVYGHIAMGLDQVLHDMESEGYTTQTFVVPACGLNAPHKRDRLWIVCNLADTKSEGLQGLDKRSPTISSERDEITDIGTKGSRDKNVSNTHDPRDRTSKHETNQDGQTIEQRREVISQSESSRHDKDVSNTNSGLRRRGTTIGESRENKVWGFYSEKKKQTRVDIRSKAVGCNVAPGKETWWTSESAVRGIPNGISYELDKNRANRIKALGNAIVPQIAREFGLAIKKVLSDSDSDGQGGQQF